MIGYIFPVPYRRKPKLVTQYFECIARAALEDHENTRRTNLARPT